MRRDRELRIRIIGRVGSDVRAFDEAGATKLTIGGIGVLQEASERFKAGRKGTEVSRKITSNAGMSGNGIPRVGEVFKAHKNACN